MIQAADFPQRWNIDGSELIAETFSSRIWKVRLSGGVPAVVKDLKPIDDVEDELRGAHLLSWRDGLGMVRLIDMDGRRMLLEYAGERMLSHALDENGDTAATEIAAEVLARLHAPGKRPAPPQLQPLETRFADLFRKAEADRESGSSGAYIAAAEIALRLLCDQRDARPLHGDLHHDNIMQGSRGWLAIDPKGVFGDPAFDAANLFHNPLGRDDLCLDPERIAAMAMTLSRRLAQDPRRLLDYAIAYGCLSAAWHAGDGSDRDEKRALAIADAIGKVRLSF